MADPYDDPHAVVRAWAERMTLRYSKTLWDQVRGEELTWVDALHRHTSTKEALYGVPIFSNENIETAILWETRGEYPENLYWPLWAQPWDRKDKQPCRSQDHKWTLSIEEGQLRVWCTDACLAGPNCTAVYTGGAAESRDNYDLGACINVEDRWEDMITSVVGEFNIRLDTHHESGSWEDGGGYTEYTVSPVFDPDSIICGLCGAEAFKHRHAISRYNKGMKICSECGRMEAMRQYELRMETEIKEMEEADA